MIESSYWFDESEKYREQALVAAEPDEQRELFDLARICTDIAIRLEDRATGG